MKKIILLLSLICIKQTNAQIITTVVGTGYGAGTGFGNYSGDGGLALIAEMHGPHGIVFDKYGNLFISEDVNSVIRRVNKNDTIFKYGGPSPYGVYSGNGGYADTTQFLPTGMTFDKNGNLYIADGYNVIRKINTQNIVTTYAGNYLKSYYAGGLYGTGFYGGDGGNADSAMLSGPTDIAFDKHGNMFIADFGNNLIRKVDTLGIITTVAGDTTGVTSYTCGAPCNTGYGGDGGPATKAKLYNPMGITVDNADNLYIADNGNNLVRMVNSTGIITTIAGDTTGIHTVGNHGYSGNGGQATLAKLNGPTKVCFDAFNNMYIADSYNDAIRKVNTSGIISTYVGTGGAGYTGDNGLATAATMNQPYYILFDTLNNLYIADWYNNVIRKVTMTNGIDQHSPTNQELKIYPNPSSNSITIQSSTELGAITIYNALGEKVKETRAKNQEPRVEVDISNLPSGIYTILAQGKYLKLVKE